MATSFTLLIVAEYLALTIIYNGGAETTNSQLIVSLIIVGVAVVISIVVDIIIIRKEDSNLEKVIEMKNKMEKYEVRFHEKEDEAEYLRQQIEDLKSENRQLRNENHKLNKTLYQIQHPDLDDPEW